MNSLIQGSQMITIDLAVFAAGMLFALLVVARRPKPWGVYIGRIERAGNVFMRVRHPRRLPFRTLERTFHGFNEDDGSWGEDSWSEESTGERPADDIQLMLTCMLFAARGRDPVVPPPAESPASSLPGS